MVTTALVLRSVPESLLPLAPTLLARGRSLTGSGRLPLLLWVLLQGTRRAHPTTLHWLTALQRSNSGAQHDHKGARHVRKDLCRALA